MRRNVILIDFESVQPAQLAALDHEHFKVIVFVGANQARIPFETVDALQRMGSRAEYIKIAGSGPNALDFHIAFYIGQLAAADPSAYFHIISKDKGFDPLIQHLKAKKILAARSTCVSEMPLIKAVNTSQQERLQFVMDKLRQPKATKPRTVKTLSSAISSLFQKQLAEEEIAALIAGLISVGFITVTENKVKYSS
ncbi:MAG: PIN domain-containing protein [Lentisphaerota bacterium]